MRVFWEQYGGAGGALPPMRGPRSAAPPFAVDLRPALSSGQSKRRDLRRCLPRAGRVPGRCADLGRQRAPARGPMGGASQEKREARLVGGPLVQQAAAWWGSSSGCCGSSSSSMWSSKASAMASAVDSSGWLSPRSVLRIPGALKPVRRASSDWFHPRASSSSRIFCRFSLRIFLTVVNLTAVNREVR